MKLFSLIWTNLWRRKVRTVCTLLVVLFAFALFGLLGAVKKSFSMGVDITGADRLVVIHKISLIMPLPISYEPRIAQVPGVEQLTHMSWFGGVYQEPKNFFPQMAVQTDTFLDIYPEYELPPDHLKAWLADRSGAIVGRATMERFGWKIGDKIPIQATIYSRRDGLRTWEFNIVGVYDGRKGVDTSQMFFHYDYLKEAAARGGDLVGWYTIRIADPQRANEVASQIDAAFANSPYETKTSTERAFAESFANQMGNIGAIVQAIASAVLLAMLLVVGNTMAQTVRERTSELAVLKTLGFTNRQVLGLVIAESCLLALLGAVLGLGLSWGLLAPGIGQALRQFLPVFYVPANALLLGLAIALLLGLLSSLFPGVQAMRLRIVDALRRV